MRAVRHIQQAYKIPVQKVWENLVNTNLH